MFFPGINFLNEFRPNLSPIIEKMKKGELTLENILDEDSIIQDIKSNNDSQFLNFFTNEQIKKLIDYSTKMPLSNDHKIGYKYPFNATEILCSENANFQKKLMSEKIIEEEKDEVDILNKIQKRGGFLVKLFEAINKTDNNNADDDESESVDEEDEEEIHIEENKENKNSKVIYENIDYLFGFFNEYDETKENYVLAGYFYKILTNLINVHAIKIVQYLFDYPKIRELDILGMLVKHMNKKSMCNIVQRLLLFDEDLTPDLEDKKIILLEKVFKELDETNDKNKYEFICDSLSTTMNNKQFFELFMKKPNLLEIVYNTLIRAKQNMKKINSLLRLLTKINDNILQHFEVKYTQTYQENNNDLMPNFDNYYAQNKSLSSPEDNTKSLKNLLLTLFNILEKNNFSFLDDLGNYAQEENVEFIATYLEPQKKIGIKKIIQSEYIRTVLDIFVNSYASEYHKDLIEQLINIANNQNIFWNLHNLFLMFPFSNIYQIYYSQILEIVLNENSPNCLIDDFFIEKRENKNIINILIDNILNNLKFNFKLTNTSSLNPLFPYIISLLNKICDSQNLYLKSLIEKNKDLQAFDEIMGKEIKEEIFGQKLLLSDQGINFGDSGDENLSSFGPKSLLDLLEEDYKIYNAYKKGEDYEKLLKEKKDKKKEEKEKMEKENEIKNKKKKIQYIDDLDEEDDPLFKVEKVNLENERDNFLSLLNKPIEEVYKDEKKFNTIDTNINNNQERVDIKELEDDVEENKNIVIDENEKEKINNENETPNEDISPNSLENKIYHIEYNGKTIDNKEEKNENQLEDK